MHIFLHFIYMLGTAAAIIAGIPQLRKLITTKQADEFSIPTWLIWLLSQITALSYAISMHDLLFISVSAVWFGFYVIMVSLIFKYRTRKPEQEVLLAEEA